MTFVPAVHLVLGSLCSLSTYYVLGPVNFGEQLCGASWRRGLSCRQQWPASQECSWASVLPLCPEGHLPGDLLGNCEQVLAS